MGELRAYLEKIAEAADDNAAAGYKFMLDAMERYQDYGKLRALSDEAQRRTAKKALSIFGLGGEEEEEPFDLQAELGQHIAPFTEHMKNEYKAQGWKMPYLVSGWQRAMDYGGEKPGEGLPDLVKVGDKFGRRPDALQAGIITMIPQVGNLQNWGIQEAVRRGGDWLLKNKGIAAAVGIPLAGLAGAGVNALFSREPDEEEREAQTLVALV